MKWYKFEVGQSVVLGSVEAVLKKNEFIFTQEVIKASPNIEKVKSRFNNKSKTSSSFQEVPATEDQSDFDVEKLTQDHVYIPETQALDETNTYNYETDSYQIHKDTQSIFSELPDEDGKNEDLLYTFHDKVESNDDSNYDDREGSVTPELLLDGFFPVNIKQEPLTQIQNQSDVATQLFQLETLKSSKSLQSEIATQLFEQPPEQSPIANNNSLYNCETQQLPLIDNVIKTRKQTKNESLKISRIKSLAVFDIATQPMISKSINKHIYDVATQVVEVSHMFDSPIKTIKLKKKSSRNRIFDSSDDDEDNFNNLTPLKSLTISQGDNTPDFIPKPNNGSQMDRDIAEVNLSQNSDDEFSFLIRNDDSDDEKFKELDNHPVKPKTVPVIVKKTNRRKNLMKFHDSEIVFFEGKTYDEEKLSNNTKSTKKSDPSAPVSNKGSKKRDSARTSDPSPPVQSKISKRRESDRTSDPSASVSNKESKRRDSARTSDLSPPVQSKLIRKKDSDRSLDPPVKETDIIESKPSDSPAKSTRSTNKKKITTKSLDALAKEPSISKLKAFNKSLDTYENESSVSKRGASSKTSKSPPATKDKAITKKSSTKLSEPSSSELKTIQKDLNLKRPLAENVLKNSIVKRKCLEKIPDPQLIVAVTNFADKSKIQNHCKIMGKFV